MIFLLSVVGTGFLFINKTNQDDFHKFLDYHFDDRVRCFDWFGIESPYKNNNSSNSSSSSLGELTAQSNATHEWLQLLPPAPASNYDSMSSEEAITGNGSGYDDESDEDDKRTDRDKDVFLKVGRKGGTGLCMSRARSLAS